MNEEEAILCQDIDECELGTFSNLPLFQPDTDQFEKLNKIYS